MHYFITRDIEIIWNNGARKKYLNGQCWNNIAHFGLNNSNGKRGLILYVINDTALFIHNIK